MKTQPAQVFIITYSHLYDAVLAVFIFSVVVVCRAEAHHGAEREYTEHRIALYSMV